MTTEEIKLELELAGLSIDQQRKILSWCQTHGYNAKELDKKLMLMGFEPVFAMYEDDSEKRD